MISDVAVSSDFWAHPDHQGFGLKRSARWNLAQSFLQLMQQRSLKPNMVSYGSSDLLVARFFQSWNHLAVSRSDLTAAYSRCPETQVQPSLLVRNPAIGPLPWPFCGVTWHFPDVFLVRDMTSATRIGRVVRTWHRHKAHKEYKAYAPIPFIILKPKAVGDSCCHRLGGFVMICPCPMVDHGGPWWTMVDHGVCFEAT